MSTVHLWPSKEHGSKSLFICNVTESSCQFRNTQVGLASFDIFFFIEWIDILTYGTSLMSVLIILLWLRLRHCFPLSGKQIEAQIL